MKSLSLAILLAAFVLEVNLPVHANSTHLKVSIQARTGIAHAHYNEASQLLTLRMAVSEGKERVLIYLTGRGGTVIFKDKSIVGERGTTVEIPMSDLPTGNYFLRVKGSQLSYSMRIKHQ